MANLRIERDGDVLRVTLARPERRNAFDAALIAELARRSSTSGRARAVVLAGEGPSFCAGADVEWMRSSVDLTYDENVADALALRRMLEAIDGCPAPVDLPRARPRPRRRRGPRRVRGRRARRPGRGLRLLGGEARDRPGRDLAVRAREDRPELGAAAVPDGRALRAQSRTADRTRPRAGRRPRRGGGARPPELRAAGPRAARAAKRLVLERLDGLETARRIAERRTSDEGQEGLRAFLEAPPAAWARLGTRTGARDRYRTTSAGRARSSQMS